MGHGMGHGMAEARTTELATERSADARDDILVRVTSVGLGPGDAGRRPDEPLPGWLRLLAVLLTVGEPLGLASTAARLAPTLGDRGAGVALLLVVRVVVTGFGVAAGLAIVGRRPHAARFAALALGLLATATLVSLLTPILPSDLPPDLTTPAVVAVAAYYGAWLAYLRLSRRVRRLFD